MSVGIKDGVPVTLATFFLSSYRLKKMRKQIKTSGSMNRVIELYSTEAGHSAHLGILD